MSRKRHAPATQRNREPILAVLGPLLESSALVLEVASGSGEHALYFATMGAAGLAAAVFVLLALRGSGRRTLRGVVLVSGGIDFVLGWLVFMRSAPLLVGVLSPGLA